MRTIRCAVLTHVATVLFAAALSGCGSGGETTPVATTVANANEGVAGANVTTLRPTLMAAGNEKAADPDNLIDFSDRWLSWDGTLANVYYDTAGDTLRLGSPEAGHEQTIGVRRFDTPLVAGTLYTLQVIASDTQAVAILYPFDAAGKFVPLGTGTDAFWAIAHDGAPKSFIAPSGVAGFFLEVRSQWHAASDTLLLPVVYTGIPESPTGPNLSGLAGQWSDWTGNPSGVIAEPDGLRLRIAPPEVGTDFRIAVQRFDKSLVAGRRYRLSVDKDTSDPGTTMLLYLFDAQGRPFMFRRGTSTGQSQPWIAAQPGESYVVTIPEGVTRFAIQVQSPWRATRTTWIAPRFAESPSEVCYPILKGLDHLVDSQGPQDLQQPTSSLAISDDGDVIAFTTTSPDAVYSGTGSGNTSAAGAYSHVFLIERASRRITRITPPTVDGTSPKLSLSGNGRYVLFESTATNLIAGETDRNGEVEDVFLYDRQDDRIRRVTDGTSLQPQRLPGFFGYVTPRLLSSDGTVLVYNRRRPNLTQYQGTWCRFSDCEELFVLDRASGRISQPLASYGDLLEYTSLSLSGNGRYLAVTGQSGASRGMVVLDLATAQSRVFPAEFSSYHWPSMSADGRTLVYTGLAENRLPGEPSGLGTGVYNIFTAELPAGGVRRIWGGVRQDEYAMASQVSASGDHVALVMTYGTTIGAAEIFLHHRPSRTTTRVLGPDFAYPAISADGRVLAVRGISADHAGIFVARVDYACGPTFP